MKISEIRALNNNELLKQMEDSYRELFNVRLRISTRQLANNRELPKIRKRISRIKLLVSRSGVGCAWDLALETF